MESIRNKRWARRQRNRRASMAALFFALFMIALLLVRPGATGDANGPDAAQARHPGIPTVPLGRRG